MHGNASLAIHWNEGLEELTIETNTVIELNYHSIPQAPTRKCIFEAQESKKQ